MILHNGLDDLLNDDLSVILLHDVDFLFFDDHSNDDFILKVLILSSAC